MTTTRDYKGSFIKGYERLLEVTKSIAQRIESHAYCFSKQIMSEITLFHNDERDSRHHATKKNRSRNRSDWRLETIGMPLKSLEAPNCFTAKLRS